MHKKIIALIVSATALTSAHAATELYGSIELGMTRSYSHNPAEGNMLFNQIGESSSGLPIYQTQRAGTQALSIDDYGSYIGLRGSESLGENVQLIYNLRWAFNAADGGENGEGFEKEIAMIGLETSLGTFALGQMDNPFYEVIKADSVSDEFYALGLSASAAAAGDILLGDAGSINTFDAEMWEYLGNSVIYTSPSIAGFIFTAGVVATSDNERYSNNRDIDLYTVSLAYEHDSGFYSRIGYLSADIAEDAKRAFSYGAQIGFRTDDWGITGNYAYAQNKSAESFGIGNAHSEFFWDEVNDQELDRNNYKHTAKGWDIGAYWSFGADHDTTLRATYGQATSKRRHSGLTDENYIARNQEDNHLKTLSVGVEQALSERTALWLEYQHSMIKQKFSTSGMEFSYVDQSLSSKKFKDNQLSIGIRHDF
ncbi:porin [Wohlfahrtiimonas larvae]|uniref:Porin domain-containing protein n=1 Tax=Wohlfahrtiimonas larvae TaxID=1157986 RepID=A0ABP9MZW3_9GAMM|nr:porin [Wohlfahrtiimonas larvae]